MLRSAIRTLFVAAALLLTTTACDKGADTKAGAKDDKKAEPAANDTKMTDPEPPADTGPMPADDGAAAEAGAAEAGAAEAGAAEGDKDDDADGDKDDDADGDKDDDADGDKDDDDDGDDDDGDEKAPAKADPKPAPDKPTSVAKVDGKPIFETKCKSCHGLDGKGDTTIGKKVEIPSLAGTKLSQSKAVSVITNGVADTKMKAYKDKLSKEEIDAVAAYVRKL